MPNNQNAKRRTRSVLIISDFADVNGGQAKVAIDSARLLADSGLNVTFFAGSGPVSPVLEHPGIRTVCLQQHTLMDNPSRLNAMASGLWNGTALLALKREVARHNPADTVLHCHGWAKTLSPSIGRELGRGRLPVLYTMHEYFLACPNGGFFDYRAQEICRRRPLSAACLSTNCDSRHIAHKYWRLARSFIARGPGRLPDGLTDIAYISETQRAAIAPYLPASACLHHVPNPVSWAGPPVQAHMNSDYVFVGRLSPEKGAVSFAKAAREAGVRAVFVGGGPEADQIRVVNPDAVITGWVAPEAVQSYLALARAVVFPSLWYEGQPLVPIEALLRGVPVICGTWSAAHEVVQDGINGVLYDRPEVGKLAEAILKVQKIGSFDSTALAKTVSPARHLERLMDIYDALLTRNVAGHDATMTSLPMT
jgi:glycosyltransferase involved in cell wall biosynthesis